MEWPGWPPWPTSRPLRRTPGTPASCSWRVSVVLLACSCHAPGVLSAVFLASCLPRFCCVSAARVAGGRAAGRRLWEGVVHYAPKPATGESHLSFDTGGGVQHIVHSKQTVQRYPAPRPGAPAGRHLLLTFCLSIRYTLFWTGSCLTTCRGAGCRGAGCRPCWLFGRSIRSSPGDRPAAGFGSGSFPCSRGWVGFLLLTPFTERRSGLSV
jgi:hypothetical protein